MTERRGWCPTLFEPMPSGDGLLVRVKPPGGRMSAEAARSLAEAAARCGNGIIELTSRANLQIRGLSPESVGPFAAAMIACGLANADADAERRRNVMASPLAGDDRSLAPDTETIAAAIERGLIEERRFATLPPKFGILVDGGGVLPLDGIGADIAVRSAGPTFALSLDWDTLAVACAPEHAALSALRLAHAFLDLATTLSRKPRRMRELVQAVGAEAVFRAASMHAFLVIRLHNETVMAAVSPRLSGSELRLADANYSPSCPGLTRASISCPLNEPHKSWPVLGPAIGRTRGMAGSSPAMTKLGSSPRTVEFERSEPDNHGIRLGITDWDRSAALLNPIGYSPYPGLHRGAVGLGLPFGQMTSDTLTALADVATRFGDGMLRTTPWRAVLVAEVAENTARGLREAAERAGMIVDPADPRRNVVACPGRPACASGSVAARADAAFLAASGVLPSGIVHVSGCSKGCAHPGPAAFTLVGANGRYSTVRDGSAADVPEIEGLSIAEAAARIKTAIAA